MQKNDRRKMPPERPGVTRRFSVPTKHKDGTIDRMKLYITANTRDDGTCGEIFLKADKVGSLASGALDALGIVMSIGLQYGVPIEAFTAKLKGTTFEPNGFIGDKDFPSCSSLFDLLARFLESKFLPKENTDANVQGQGEAGRDSTPIDGQGTSG